MPGGNIEGPVCRSDYPEEVSADLGPVGTEPVAPVCLMPAPSPVAEGGDSQSYEQSRRAMGEESVSGSVLVGFGIGAVARIPIPGTNGLHIELSPRGWVPKGGSTSTLFMQSADGQRVLRLDYGYNKSSGGVDYHWNQKSTFADFGIADHTTTGPGGKALYQSAKYFKYAGRVLLVLGAAVDIYSIVVAEKRWRQVSKVVAGWAGATGGCKLVGAGGAYAGSFAEPGLGTAIGGFLGCMAGGVGGYWGASWAAGEVYDYVEEIIYHPVPQVAQP